MTYPFVGTHTPADWKSWKAYNVDLTAEGPRLAAASLPAYVSPSPAIDDPPDDLIVADLDVDDCGSLYLLSDDGHVYRYDGPSRELRKLPCTFEEGVETPTGLRVTADTIYVGDAGAPDADDGRVLAVSRHLLQTRWIERAAFASPVALVGEGEAVLVLDEGPAAEDGAGFLATVDDEARTSREVTGLTSPADAAVDREGNRYVLATLTDGPTGPAVLRYPPPAGEGGHGPCCDGEDSNASNGDDDQRPEPPPEGEGPDGGVILVAPDEFEVPATGSFEPACIEADHVEEVIVGVSGSDDRSLFRYRPADGAFERLDGYLGTSSTLRLARDRETCDADALYAVSGDGRDVVVLDARRAHRLNAATGRYDAQLVARLDAGDDRVQWHRVTTGLAAGSGTEVRVRYFATDDEELRYEPGIAPEELAGIGNAIGGRLRDAGVDVLSKLVEVDAATLAEYASAPGFDVTPAEAAGWISDARDELSTHRGEDLEWQSLEPATPRDALLEEANGRYLWVRLDLVGTRFETPTVESFRAYFPRRSYLRHLPAIYEEDEESAAFLERFLSIFESVFVDVEEEIEAAIRYLDPDGVPPEYLPWLGSWLALSADETWPAAAHRELIRRAPELFRYRGTEAGLLAATGIFLGDRFGPSATTEWYLTRQLEAIEARRKAGRLDDEAARRAIERLDPEPFVWETPDLSCADEAVRPIYERLLPCSQCFALVVPPFVDDAAMETVERIVRAQAPAHTTGRAVRLQEGIQLAGDERDRAHHTYLGVNSVLAERDFVVEESSLGEDSELAEREPDGQLGFRSRLGTDTQIS